MSSNRRKPPIMPWRRDELVNLLDLILMECTHTKEHLNLESICQMFRSTMPACLQVIRPLKDIKEKAMRLLSTDQPIMDNFDYTSEEQATICYWLKIPLPKVLINELFNTAVFQLDDNGCVVYYRRVLFQLGGEDTEKPHKMRIPGCNLLLFYLYKVKESGQKITSEELAEDFMKEYQYIGNKSEIAEKFQELKETGVEINLVNSVNERFEAFTGELMSEKLEAWVESLENVDSAQSTSNSEDRVDVPEPESRKRKASDDTEKNSSDNAPPTVEDSDDEIVWIEDSKSTTTDRRSKKSRRADTGSDLEVLHTSIVHFGPPIVAPVRKKKKKASRKDPIVNMNYVLIDRLVQFQELRNAISEPRKLQGTEKHDSILGHHQKLLREKYNERKATESSSDGVDLGWEQPADSHEPEPSMDNSEDFSSQATISSKTLIIYLHHNLLILNVPFLEDLKKKAEAEEQEDTETAVPIESVKNSLAQILQAWKDGLSIVNSWNGSLSLFEMKKFISGFGRVLPDSSEHSEFWNELSEVWKKYEDTEYRVPAATARHAIKIIFDLCEIKDL